MTGERLYEIHRCAVVEVIGLHEKGAPSWDELDEATRKVWERMAEGEMSRIEERLEKLVAHAADAMDRFNPVPGNEEGDMRAFGANASRRGGLEDALKVVRGEEDSIGDSA